MFDIKEVSIKISNYIQNVVVIDSNLIPLANIDISHFVNQAYQQNEYGPIWFAPKQIKKSASLLPINLLNLLDEGILLKGISTSRIATINEVIIDAFNNNRNISSDSIALWDRLFTTAYLEGARALLMGNQSQSNMLKNDSIFNGALYLVLQANNNNEFASFDAFRPQHPLYTNILIQIKSLIILQNDTIYQNLLSHFRKEQQEKTALELIMKELHYASQLTSNNFATDSLVATYQRYYYLPITKQLDQQTLHIIHLQPNEKREKMQINLEHLRLLPQQASDYSFRWTLTK